MKVAAFEEITQVFKTIVNHTTKKINKLEDTTNTAIKEIQQQKNDITTMTEKIDKTIQNEIDLKNLIGLTENTGGSTSTGTLMGKLNKLLTDWTTTRAGYINNIYTYTSNLNSWLTSTRAGRLDNIGTPGDIGGTTSAGTIMAKLNALLTGSSTDAEKIGNIGETTDTGGTNSAGSVMAKLNKLLTDWTTTRAGYISNIYTYTSNLNSRLTTTRVGRLDNIGTTTDTGGTTTAGSVMAKLNKLLSASSTSNSVGIKSVQYGTFVCNMNGFITINISTINPSKTFIIVDGGRSGGSGYQWISKGYIEEVSSTSFKYHGYSALKSYADTAVTYSYQVIEFY